jgi:hypothetical protein
MCLHLFYNNNNNKRDFDRVQKPRLVSADATRRARSPIRPDARAHARHASHLRAHHRRVLILIVRARPSPQITHRRSSRARRVDEAVTKAAAEGDARERRVVTHQRALETRVRHDGWFHTSLYDRSRAPTTSVSTETRTERRRQRARQSSKQSMNPRHPTDRPTDRATRRDERPRRASRSASARLDDQKYDRSNPSARVDDRASRRRARRARTRRRRRRDAIARVRVNMR